MRPTIRLATEADARQIQAIYAPFCAESIVSFEAEPPTVEAMRGRIQSVLERYPWLVCLSDQEILGYVYACRHRERAAYQWSVDTTVYIKEGERRSGVGRALYTSLFRLLALQGYYNVYAGIALPNPGSVGLHEAMGFRPVGVYEKVGHKLGAWHDVGWWQLALRPHDVQPKSPVLCTEVMESVAWQSAIEAGLRLLGGGQE